MKSVYRILLAILINLLWTGNLFAQEVVIIVNEKNPVSELTDRQIENYFLKKIRQWPNGTPVKFFDQRDDGAERKIFLNNILKKSSREIELFWIGQKLYSGNSAPLQISSDSMMASMVARFPGAIGYVSSSFSGAPGVKKVFLRMD